MNLKFNINIEEITKDFDDLKFSARQSIQKAVENLAALTKAKAEEFAQAELHSSRQIFLDNLGWETIAPGVHVVYLDEDALWIEEGIPSNKDMKPDLLKGHKYRIIPFKYSKEPSSLTPVAQQIVKEIKSNIAQENRKNKNDKENKIHFKKTEYDSQGSPKTGLIHRFDWKSKPLGKGNTSALKGVSFYQTLTKTGNVRKDIIVYRTVSSGPKSAGKWIHPGLQPKKILDKSLEWAIQEWETKILPDILKEWE